MFSLFEKEKEIALLKDDLHNMSFKLKITEQYVQEFLTANINLKVTQAMLENDIAKLRLAIDDHIQEIYTLKNQLNMEKSACQK